MTITTDTTAVVKSDSCIKKETDVDLAKPVGCSVDNSVTNTKISCCGDEKVCIADKGADTRNEDRKDGEHAFSSLFVLVRC